MPTTPANVKKLEWEVLQAKQRLAEAIREQAAQPIGEYTLRHVPSGSPVAFSALFGTSSDLLVVHNMGQRCPYCTLWADGFSSVYKHLANRCGFVLTTPDAPDVAGAFASARGWTFPLVSHAGTSFAKDMGYHNTSGDDGQFGPYEPGISGFHKRSDGTVVRTGTRPFGPGDDFCVVWPMLDLLPKPAQDWTPRFHY